MTKAIAVKESAKSPIYSGVYEGHPIPDPSFSDNVGIVVRSTDEANTQIQICRNCPARNESLKIAPLELNDELLTIVTCRPRRKKMRLCVDY